MSLLTCGGADVLHARLSFPARGAWFAELELDTSTPPSGAVTIAAANGLTAKGTVANAGAYLDTSHCRIIGGAGGLGTIVSPAAYANALLSDPLNAVLSSAGEILSSKVDASITSTFLQTWTLVAQSAAASIDRLAFAAGASVTWRVLDDGTVWLGVESWASQKLPPTSDIVGVFPAQQRVEIAAETPSLLPGVNIDGIGKIASVEHWIEPESTRTWVWLA